MNSKKVLLVGWDAADWDVILPMAEAGEMPCVARLINQGIMGNMATLEPAYSPMLWTSIATGKRPDKHGILGFAEPRPDGQGIRPVSSTSRKCKAIWNILMQNGFQSNIIGWWPSHPVEPIDGMMVSNLFQKTSSIHNQWPMPERSVHPASLSELVYNLRVHPMELTANHILPFVPRLADVDQDKDRRVSSIADLISEAASVQSVATWALENRPWDFAAVYFDTIDHFCHGFMKYRPPKTDWVSDEDFDKYKEAVNGAYRMMDMMLYHLIQLAGKDTTVILISDHGFRSGSKRFQHFSFEPAGPADQHRDHGIFCISGPGVRKDNWVFGATLLDITPTILTLFGLPVGRDMDGTPLVQVFEKPPAIKVIDSWEQVPGDGGQNTDNFEEDPASSAAAIQQLIELGYIEDPGADEKGAMIKIANELQYNKARSLMGAGRFSEAEEILLSLAPSMENEGRIVLRLVDCLRENSKVDQALEILEQFTLRINNFIESVDENSLREEVKQLPDCIDKNHPLVKKLQALRQAKNDRRTALLSKAQLLYVTGASEEAMTLLNKNRSLMLKFVPARLLQAKIESGNKKYQKAIDIYQSIAETYPETVPAFIGMAVNFLKLRKWEEAANAALEAINLMYYNPAAHFYLGNALLNLKDYEHAAMAYETCLRMNPGIGKARKKLTDIYTKFLPNPAKMAALQFLFNSTPENGFLDGEEEIRPQSSAPAIKQMKTGPRQTTVVVSGLPRSGTSLLMQILQAGGMELLSDQKRVADENNPQGYYELDAVKNSARSVKWLNQSGGKVVKVVSHLLKYLPGNRDYKVIFMNRDLHEIIASQQKMTGKADHTYPVMLENQYRKHLEMMDRYLKNNPNFEVLKLNYTDIINDPETACSKISAFLNLPLSEGNMQGVVNKNLYRNRYHQNN